jgi:hypothetical protein
MQLYDSKAVCIADLPEGPDEVPGFDRRTNSRSEDKLLVIAAARPARLLIPKGYLLTAVFL